MYIRVQQRCRRAQREPHRGGVPRRRRQARELAVVSASVVGRAPEPTVCRQLLGPYGGGCMQRRFSLDGQSLTSTPVCAAPRQALRDRQVLAPACAPCSHVGCCQETLSSSGISAAPWCVAAPPRTKCTCGNYRAQHGVPSQWASAVTLRMVELARTNNMRFG